jgi:hypothetical protein
MYSTVLAMISQVARSMHWITKHSQMLLAAEKPDICDHSIVSDNADLLQAGT